MIQPVPGQRVSFLDDWRQEARTGVVMALRRSTANPWRVAIVRLTDGTEMEVHPDRLESAGEDQHDR
jgi:hypothetical protein